MEVQIFHHGKKLIFKKSCGFIRLIFFYSYINSPLLLGNNFLYIMEFVICMEELKGLRFFKQNGNVLILLYYGGNLCHLRTFLVY